MKTKKLIILSALMASSFAFAQNTIGEKYIPSTGDQQLSQEDNSNYYNDVTSRQYKTSSNNVITTSNGVITRISSSEKMNECQLKIALGQYYSDYQLVQKNNLTGNNFSNNNINVSTNHVSGTSKTEINLISLKSVGNVKRYNYA